MYPLQGGSTIYLGLRSLAVDSARLLDTDNMIIYYNGILTSNDLQKYRSINVLTLLKKKKKSSCVLLFLS